MPATSPARTAGVLLALAAGWAAWWWGLGGRYRFLTPEWFQFESPQRVTYDGNVDLETISPDGKYLAYATVNGSDETLHVRRLADGGEKLLPVTQNHYLGLTFSPDTQALYYLLKNPQEELGLLYRMKLPSGIPSLILENVDGAVTFSPDAQQFAFLRLVEERGSSVSSIFVARTRNPANAHVMASQVNTQMKEQLAWSPKGDQIAAIAFPTHVDAPTQPAVYLFSSDGRVKGEFSPQNLRSLNFPVWVDNGASLVFSGRSLGAEQSRLQQLYLPSGQFHELPSALSFESISATKDSSVLAAVSSDKRSSIWVAGANNLASQPSGAGATLAEIARWAPLEQRRRCRAISQKKNPNA
jgi:Tol biopolymer transport system component